MFRKSTVFILGAGASWHYGYPTGEELVARVIEVADKLTTYFTAGYENQSGSIPKFALRNHRSGAQIPVAVWSEAAIESTRLGRRLREVNPTLIDYFLAQNADLHDIGRLAIALVIFSCESAYHREGGNPNHVHLQKLRLGRGETTTSFSSLNLKAFKDDWLRFILYNLTVGCSSSNHLTQNRVNFISFNYDTSLEWRLYRGLTNISHFQRPHIEEFMADSRFLHVYGSLREKTDDQWTTLRADIPQHYDQSFHNYRVTLDNIFDASKGIRTIDGKDKLANEKTLIDARGLIDKAEVIYILGFGFDVSNVRRLELECLAPARSPARAVYFTNFRDLDSVSMAAGRALLRGPNIFLSGSPQTYEASQFYEGRLLHFRYQMSTKNVYDAISEDFESMGAATE